MNHDGKLDLVYGQGHGYGLYWLEQSGTPDHPQWLRHTIDESFSQSHAVALIDIDGDGTPELITGKRYRGHSGGDPGSYDPVVVYAYKLPDTQITHDAAVHVGDAPPRTEEGWPAAMATANPASDPLFIRHTLSINGTATISTQIVAADFDHDGDIDIATAGKLGVNVLENLKVNKIPKDAREATQPINRKWPFPGEGKEIDQEDGPPVPK